MTVLNDLKRFWTALKFLFYLIRLIGASEHIALNVAAILL